MQGVQGHQTKPFENVSMVPNSRLQQSHAYLVVSTILWRGAPAEVQHSPEAVAVIGHFPKLIWIVIHTHEDIIKIGCTAEATKHVNIQQI